MTEVGIVITEIIFTVTSMLELKTVWSCHFLNSSIELQ